MRDEWFIRGRVPMTKSEVRAISLSRLELKPGAVLYDVGAGTGSVSIEAALSVPGCQVFAVERKPEAAEPETSPWWRERRRRPSLACPSPPTPF